MSYYGIQRNKPDDEICHFKYIDRYKKNGKWQYVYEESKNKVGNAKSALKTNLSNVKTNIQNTSKEDIGRGVRNTARAAKIKVRGNYNKAKIAAKEGINTVKSTARDTANKTVNTAKDKLGYDEKAKYEKALDKNFKTGSSAGMANYYHNTKDKKYATTEHDVAVKEKAHTKAANELAEAKKAYYKTPRGKVTQVAEGIVKTTDRIDETAGEKFRATKAKAKKAIDNAKTAPDRKREAYNTATDQLQTAWDREINAMKKRFDAEDSGSERKIEKAQQQEARAQAKRIEAGEAYVKAAREYMNSPVGIYDTVVKPTVETNKQIREIRRKNRHDIAVSRRYK